MDTRLLALALTALSSAGQCFAAAELPIVDFERLPRYDDASLSPTGEYLAAKVPFEGGSLLAVLSRKDMKVTTTVKGGPKTYVEGHSWLTANRVAVAMSMTMDDHAQRGSLPGFYVVNADGSDRREGWGIVYDRLPGDRVALGTCNTRCDAVRVTSAPAGKLLRRGKHVDLPKDFWDTVLDVQGRPVLAWGDGEDDDSLEEVRILRGERWETFYDEAVGKVNKTPLGVNREGTVAWFLSETERGPSMIEAADLRTGKFTPVLRHARVDPEELIWSADHRTLVGAWFHDGKPEPLYVDPDAPEAQLTEAVVAAFPDEWARIAGFSEDRAVALVAVNSDRDPGRYYLFDVATRKLSFLTAASPWIDPGRMARTQPFRFKARDGLELAGLLTLPTTGKSPYPLVVIPHGGPMVRDYWEQFDGETQLLANRGYAVLKVDFRGSGGYGRAFERKAWLQWGLSMQDDVTDATRWAIAQGHADASRICIYGGSYGGYAALMGVVREPTLYRCAIGVAGVYDLGVMRDWGDTNDSKQGRKYLDDALGKDRALLARQSPARRAREIRVPVLVAQGYRDERVSAEHYRKMTQALDAAGATYETFLRGDEGHGWFDEEDRVAFAERVLSFLARSMSGAAPAAKAGEDAGAP